MSILLEALRKSEKRQRPHAAPGIHTDDQSAPVSEPLKTGPLALLLAAALFVSGWFVWHQYEPPAGSYPPPVTLTDDKIQVVNPPVVKPAVAGGRVTQAAPSSAVVDQAAGQQRTPVESYQQTVSNILQAKPGGPPATQAVDDGGSQAASRAKAPAKPVKVARKKRVPQKPAPIGYWDLPDVVRADVPEIKFSVLVYANNPAERFVLINGQRLVEGDSSEPGLVVKEIRLDGVVFSYRLYQFLVER